MPGNPIWSKRETAETLRRRCPTSVLFLRELADCMSGFCELSRDRMAEAADEIERLRGDLETANKLIRADRKAIQADAKEITQLRAENKRLQEQANPGTFDDIPGFKEIYEQDTVADVEGE